jgi:hypothetical protein
LLLSLFLLLSLTSNIAAIPLAGMRQRRPTLRAPGISARAQSATTVLTGTFRTVAASSGVSTSSAP